jgi:phosphoribosyl 1,2-cyclic phosphodiesterase
MTTKTKNFTATFWGVRGTFPITGASVMQYGGNTSCVELNCNDVSIILDAGTGIRALGEKIKSQHIDILLSHSHIDHISGLPFFKPAYDSSRQIDVWAGHLKPEHSLPQVISHIMSPPIFPITDVAFKAKMHYHDFTAGGELKNERWEKAGIHIKTLALNHPDRATGYRIEHAGHSLCYITDIEHVPGQINKELVSFVKNTDYLIYDATYSDENFQQHKGWGHSTWQEAVRIADAAGVKTLVLFHHDPEATDEILDKRTVQIEKTRKGTLLAKEGVTLTICP